MIRLVVFALLASLATESHAQTDPTGLPAPLGLASQPGPLRRVTSDHTLSVEAGGMSFIAGVRYEHRLSHRLRASIGYSQLTAGDIFEVKVNNVPVSVSAVHPLTRRWHVDAGVGALLTRAVEEKAEFVTPSGIVLTSEGDTVYRVIPALNAGVRFEGQRLYIRGGASLLMSPPQELYRGWVMLPWPTLGAGVRF